MPEGDRFERSLGAGWRSAFRYAAGEVASEQEIEDKLMGSLEVWPESHWPGFALRKADVFQSDMA